MMHLFCDTLPQIPEEEKNLGPHDRLIHVYHFMKDTTQNQVVSTFKFYFNCILFGTCFDWLSSPMAVINYFHVLFFEVSMFLPYLFQCLFVFYINSRFRILENHFSWSFMRARL